jgi:hypothetical protein
MKQHKHNPMCGLLSIPRTSSLTTSTPISTTLSTQHISTQLLIANEQVSDSLNAELKIKSLPQYLQYMVMIDYKYIKNGEQLLIKRETITPDKYIFFYDMFERHPYYFDIMYSYKKCVEYLKELQSINVLYNGFSILKDNGIIFSSMCNNSLCFPLFCSFEYSVDLDLNPYPNIFNDIDMFYSSPYMNILYIFEKNKWKHNNNIMLPESWMVIKSTFPDMDKYIDINDYFGMSYSDIYIHIADTTRNVWDIYSLTIIYQSVLKCITYDNKQHIKFVGIINDIISSGGKSPEEVLSLLDYY